MIIDCHVHLPSGGIIAEWAPFTKDLFACVEYLRRCGVDRAVANSWRAVKATTPEEVRAGNEDTFAAAEEAEGLIIPACIANPDCGGAHEELERCREAGSVWLGEICGYACGVQYDTPQFESLVAKAGDLGMVVQVHADGARMRALCEAFPEIAFVLPHPVDSRSQIAERVEVLRDLPNLHLDLCGNGYERMGVLEIAAGIDPRRVLFGSDYTINDPASVMARVRQSYLDDEVKKLILGGNARRLLAERGMET